MSSTLTNPAGGHAVLPSTPLSMTPSPEPSSRSWANLLDKLFAWAALGAACLTLAALVGILLSLIVGAWPAIHEYGLGFLVRSVWDPVKGDYGGLVMIYGTLATSVIALLIAVPVSFGIALFLTELSPAWLKRPLGTAIELLAEIAHGLFEFFLTQVVVLEDLVAHRFQGLGHGIGICCSVGQRRHVGVFVIANDQRLAVGIGHWLLRLGLLHWGCRDSLLGLGCCSVFLLQFGQHLGHGFQLRRHLAFVFVNGFAFLFQAQFFGIVDSGCSRNHWRRRNCWCRLFRFLSN